MHATGPEWDSERFKQDFIASECYQKPLKLEPGNEGTFLEVRYEVKADRIRYRLKNDNEGEQVKVWRYQHFQSYSPFEQKKATLLACLLPTYTKRHTRWRVTPQTYIAGRSTKWRSSEGFDRLYPLSVLKSEKGACDDVCLDARGSMAHRPGYTSGVNTTVQRPGGWSEDDRP